MNHTCAECKTEFLCSGRPHHSTRWIPCSCLQELTDEDGKTLLKFYCCEKCRYQIEEDSEEEDDSDDPLKDPIIEKD
jgi:hypothetical protein